MHLNKNYFLLLVICITGCIEPFVPRLSEDSENVVVISGEITDQPGYQVVEVTIASPVSNPGHIPLSNCQIEIQDDQGHSFSMDEFNTGKYRAWVDKEFLNPGTSYKLQMITPGGEEISSSYDLMPSCPAVDSVYFKREDKQGTFPDEIKRGIQFYVDLKGQETDSRYYRWNIQETWEHHSLYPRELYYDGTIHRITPPDYSKMICWSAKQVDDFFTLSTKNLVNNTYKMLPLNFEDNTTRLYIGCSVLISQYALSEASYTYWEQLRINSKEQGGLYERQPLPIEGNLKNVTNSKHKVLGFFGAASVKTKRIFVGGIQEMGINYDDICAPRYYERWFLDYTADELPVNIIIVDGRVNVLDPGCVDCTVPGGTLIKPDFWPH